MAAEERNTTTRPTMEVVVEGLVGDELIDKKTMVLCDAVANESDEMAMMDAADDIHLSTELLLPLPTTNLELLHRHAPPLAIAGGEHAHVHLPEPTFADHVRRREPAGDPRQLVVREP